MKIDSDMDAWIEKRVRRSGSSFFWAMRLLPPPRRRAIYTLYAFCREVDDIADGPRSAENKHKLLDEWLLAIDMIADGKSPPQPLAAALAIQIRAFDLPLKDLVAVIEGCRMDASGCMIRPSMAALDLYCDRVSSSVGRMAIRIFGAVRDPVAFHQGRALQLTNILRDVGEDARSGRLYLPDELLAEHGINDRNISAILANPALSDACRALGGIARNHYHATRAAMAGGPKRAMRPARTMLALYEPILDRLERSGWSSSATIRLSKPERLWRALRNGLF